MKTVLPILLLTIFFNACNSLPKKTDQPSLQPQQRVNPERPQIIFRFLQESYTIRNGLNIEVKAIFENNSSSDIYIADWGLEIPYYWQVDGVMKISVLPFGYRRPEKGIGTVAASPAVFIPRFAHLKSGERKEVAVRVPPGNEKEWKLSPGKWKVKLQHLWLSDLKPIQNLAGEELFEALQKEGHFVWANADIFVE